jgi:hypothetical protein
MKSPMEGAKTIPLGQEPSSAEALTQNILTLRVADIQPTRYVSLPRPRRFFRERFEKFWGYRSEINELFDRLFPGMETLVMYHYASGFSGHVFIKKPSERNPYHVLFTAGMSHAPMRVPKSLKDRRKSLERAELLMFLSPKFPMYILGRESSCPAVRRELAHAIPWKANWFAKLGKRYDRIRYGGRYDEFWNYPTFWPIGWLEKMARLPYKNRTWIHHGSMARDGDAVNTWQAGGIFLQLGQLATRNGQQVNLYSCVPLYPEEIEFLCPQQRPLSEPERQAAHERILRDLPLIVDRHRPSLMPEGGLGHAFRGEWPQWRGSFQRT